MGRRRGGPRWRARYSVASQIRCHIPISYTSAWCVWLWISCPIDLTTPTQSQTPNPHPSPRLVNFTIHRFGDHSKSRSTMAPSAKAGYAAFSHVVCFYFGRYVVSMTDGDVHGRDPASGLTTRPPSLLRTSRFVGSSRNTSIAMPYLNGWRVYKTYKHQSPRNAVRYR